MPTGVVGFQYIDFALLLLVYLTIVPRPFSASVDLGFCGVAKDTPSGCYGFVTHPRKNATDDSFEFCLIRYMKVDPFHSHHSSRAGAT